MHPRVRYLSTRYQIRVGRTIFGAHKMLWPALVLSATAGSQLTCSECAVVQEGIFNALKYNLSYYERAAVVGTQETVTLEVGQVIWRMCEVCAGGVHTLAKRPSEAEGHTRTIAVPTAPCAIHSQSTPHRASRRVSHGRVYATRRRSKPHAESLRGRILTLRPTSGRRRARMSTMTQRSLFG